MSYFSRNDTNIVGMNRIDRRTNGWNGGSKASENNKGHIEFICAIKNTSFR